MTAGECKGAAQQRAVRRPEIFCYRYRLPTPLRCDAMQCNAKRISGGVGRVQSSARALLIQFSF
jgi:hypothetical protein